jgi:hypothetical protein
MKSDTLFRLMAQMDSHFAADDQSPADRAVWTDLKRHIMRMKDGLNLVETTLRMEREFGRPFTEEMAQGRRLCTLRPRGAKSRAEQDGVRRQI